MSSRLPDNRPNFLLIMTDQHRGDCLGIDGHPVLLTPNIDQIAGNGMRFTRAYTTCPSCIPARRSLLSGQFPATHGMVGYQEGVEWNPPATLPGELAAAGYQTVLIGRDMHQHPPRKRFGFSHMELTSGLPTRYWERLKQADPQGGIFGPGCSPNGWNARPWHLDEALHEVYWNVGEAVRFFEQTRDPSCPFFLTVSFHSPHPPLTPPAFYMERYLRQDLPEPVIGDWAEPPPNDGAGRGTDNPRVNLTGEALRSCHAAYYGLINYIDDQVCRLLYALGPLLRNTVIIFTTDHGEMLGDHYMFRKRSPYEGSARIPLLIRAAQETGFAAGAASDQPVCLEDIMPTVLELAGLEVPDTVEGRSLVPLLRADDRAEWRPYLHGEHAVMHPPEVSGNHYLTDGREKYIWFTRDGREQLFDLADDPGECHDLIDSPQYADHLALWRKRMIEELKDRPEGFTDGRRLIPGRPYENVLPHARC